MKKGCEEMNNQFNEEAKINNETAGEEKDYAFKAVMTKKENRRTMSIISLVIAVLSLVFLFIPWVALVLSIVAIVVGSISRRNLGYFDRITLAGLIIGIFGFVFSLSGILFANIISSLF